MKPRNENSFKFQVGDLVYIAPKLELGIILEQYEIDRHDSRYNDYLLYVLNYGDRYACECELNLAD